MVLEYMELKTKQGVAMNIATSMRVTELARLTLRADSQALQRRWSVR